MYDDGLEYLNKAEESRHAVPINEFNADIFRSVYNMKGDILIMTGNFKEGKKYLIKADEVIKRWFSLDQDKINSNKFDFAVLYYKTGRCNEAEQLLEEVKRYFKENEKVSMQILCNIHFVEIIINKNSDEAEKIFSESLNLIKQNDKPDFKEGRCLCLFRSLVLSRKER